MGMLRGASVPKSWMENRRAEDLARWVEIPIGRVFTGEAAARDAPLAV